MPIGKKGFQKGHRDFVPESSRKNPIVRKKLSERAKLRGNSGNGYKKGNQFIGKKNGFWKGDDAGYVALHDWVRRWKGKPKKCEHCGSTTRKMYHWANIDHKYRRVLEDYISMCVSCHKKYDIELSSKN